jgi:hypothetical protein
MALPGSLLGRRGAGRKRAGRRYRGRVAVVTALVGIVAFQVAYHVPLTLLYPRIFDLEYVDKLSHLREHMAAKPKDQPLVLGMGSSLMAMALRPGALTDTESADSRHPLVYNFALNSATIVPQLLFLQRVLNEGIRPDWVMLETWPPFFMRSDRSDPRRHPQWPADRLLRQDLPTMARYHGVGHQIRHDWRTVQISPWYSHRHRLQNWLVPSWVPNAKRVDHTWQHSDATGWECFPEYIEFHKPLYPDNPACIESIPKTMEYWADKEICEEFNAALLEVIALCRKNDIGIVLIWLPESSFYRDRSYAPPLMERIARWQQRLTEETGVPIINARDWVDDRNFVEGLHTSPEGATQFTRRLEREVLRPIVEGRMPLAHPASPPYASK